MAGSTSSGPGAFRRVVAIVIAAALAIAVLVGLLVAGGVVGGKKKTARVHGLSGSEKIAFFEDARVVKRLKRLGFEVQVEPAGSRQIATDFDLTKVDFAFPAGVPAAEKIRRSFKTLPSTTPFFTPMVVASFAPIADILVRNGIATKEAGHYTLDLHKYVDLVEQGRRWKELADSAAYPVDKRVLITSTDVRKSNSAAMYLSLLSFVANGDSVVLDRSQAEKVLPRVAPFFLEQGFVESSSEGPFDDYLAIGAGKTPLVMIYEAQFVAHSIANDGSIRPDMVLMYPEPTILSKHTFIPITGDGERLGRALATDPELQTLAVAYGFRTAQPGAFEASIKAHGLGLPAQLVNVVDPPSYEALERMITDIEGAYTQQSLDPAKPRRKTAPPASAEPRSPGEASPATPAETTEAPAPPAKTLNPGGPKQTTGLDPGRPRLSSKNTLATKRPSSKKP
jgi:hypothetical protein